MEIIPIRALRRRERRRVVVREEIYRFQQRHADCAHAAGLEKLGRDDLASYYQAILRDVKRALRPTRSGMLERLGLRKD